MIKSCIFHHLKKGTLEYLMTKPKEYYCKSKKKIKVKDKTADFALPNLIRRLRYL